MVKGLLLLKKEEVVEVATGVEVVEVEVDLCCVIGAEIFCLKNKQKQAKTDWWKNQLSTVQGNTQVTQTNTEEN